jgi:hypothetical protein
VAGEPIAVQGLEILDQPGAQGIQKNVTHQFLQIDIFLTQKGIVAIPKQVRASPMAVIASGSIPAQQPPHRCGHRDIAGFKQ